MKSLLDVADNLERAAGSVTDESLQGLSSDGKPLTAQQCNKLLTGLLEGVHLTDRILVQASAPFACRLAAALFCITPDHVVLKHHVHYAASTDQPVL